MDSDIEAIWRPYTRVEEVIRMYKGLVVTKTYPCHIDRAFCNICRKVAVQRYLHDNGINVFLCKTCIYIKCRVKASDITCGIEDISSLRDTLPDMIHTALITFERLTYLGYIKHTDTCTGFCTICRCHGNVCNYNPGKITETEYSLVCGHCVNKAQAGAHDQQMWLGLCALEQLPLANADALGYCRAMFMRAVWS